MSRIAYVNGHYVRHADAAVHIEDRGYQFGDGVYEVCEIRDRAIVDLDLHLDRLARSLAELRIGAPMSRAALTAILRQVARENRVRDGLVYIQVTRGVARRDHYFPEPAPRPALVVTARALDRRKGETAARDGIAVITRPDERWARVDIKTTGLLPNVLAKQAAREAGAREAWLVDRDGYITEGGSTNAWIVTMGGVLVTRPAARGILRGITRTVLLKAAEAAGLTVEERPFTVAEAMAAREAFVTAASTIVMPVVRIDGVAIGDGRPGPFSLSLRGGFHEHAQHTPI